jgi:hypothetical protein
VYSGADLAGLVAGAAGVEAWGAALGLARAQLDGGLECGGREALEGQQVRRYPQPRARVRHVEQQVRQRLTTARGRGGARVRRGGSAWCNGRMVQRAHGARRVQRRTCGLDCVRRA